MMGLRRGFTYDRINGNPPLAIQGGRMDPLTRAGDDSGQIFCSQRLAHIAVMRCGEYQRERGCGKGCPNAASKELIAAVASEVRPTSTNHEHESRFCIVCGEPKKSVVGDRCQHCASADTTRKRRHKGGSRNNGKFWFDG